MPAGKGLLGYGSVCIDASPLAAPPKRTISDSLNVAE